MLLLNPQTGEDYLKEALASSIFSRYPWAPKASKSSMGKRVKTAKKNIKKALKTDNVFVKIRETSMASEVLGCGTPDTETEEVCSLLSQSMAANRVRLGGSSLPGVTCMDWP